MISDMLNVTLEQLKEAEISLYEGNPVIKPFGLSTVVADPSVLTPEEAPDGKWHLFAHTLLGIYEFISCDGVKFTRVRKVVSRAMRPDIKRAGGYYFLFFERVQPLLARAAAFSGRGWKSEIYAVRSKDLREFSPPFKVLGADCKYESAAGGKGYSLSNPFLFQEGERTYLYYSCGLTYLHDCKFSEPTYIFRARREGGRFVKEKAPIIAPNKEERLFNLCGGCLKVYRIADCYIGIQNGIYEECGSTHSAIRLLSSQDGAHFTFERTLISPAGSGWMGSYVYASCLTKSGGELRLYFNARDISSPLRGRENIGFARIKVK